MYQSRFFSRRLLFRGTTVAIAASSIGIFNGSRADAEGLEATNKGCEGEVLGQAPFRYRAQRLWGDLDRAKYPVKDCHGIAEDRKGRIILLTNDTHNNLIAYEKSGKFLQAWENRFPTAHGLEIEDHEGEDCYWITDHDVQCVSVCTADGHEIRRTGPDALASKYPDLKQYHPTNSAVMPDGDFYISDGYGSSFVHHMDP
ncbi:MAG TPA: hypothetical protein VMH89_00145, partial [Candidatus Acidoferrum sp.]|nr:hypothetical protein [Candidatus Acidoferrum sp.]